MKRIILLLVGIVIMAGIVTVTTPSFLRAADSAAPSFVTQIPAGYRDWRLISVSHEAGNLNSIGVVLSNDLAITAYREGKLPYRTAQSSPLCTMGTSSRRKTTSVPGQAQSFLFPALPRTFSLWSRIPRVRRDGRLGVPCLQRRQTRRPGVDEILLPVPQSG